MQRIAKFEKISFEQFYKDWVDTFGEIESKEQVQKIYDRIKLPTRKTKGSAGYDISSTLSCALAPKESVKFPTGIRCIIENGWVFKCYPRSGLGFKYRMQLDNGVGIIDSDYAASDNEGHIFVKMTNDSKEGKIVRILEGDGIAQGIFVQYGITEDDDADGVRNGGFGSTGR